MKKIVSVFIAALLSLSVFTACGNSGSITIAVPNDTTNEARALLLLEENGWITLKDGVGITATVADIAENPHNIQFKEVEAAQLPNVLQDVDYAVINSNYAIEAKLNPVSDSLVVEGSSSAYGNILAVKEGNQNNDLIKALKAALESKKVADFIADKYKGAVVRGATAMIRQSITMRLPARRSALPLLRPRTPKFWQLRRTFWPLKTLSWILKNLPIMFSPTMWWKAAKSTPTTSSISRIWMISTPKTRPISFQSEPFMWSRWVFTAESNPIWTR